MEICIACLHKHCWHRPYFTQFNFKQQFYFPAQSLKSIFCLSLAVITHMYFSKLFKHCIAHIKCASHIELHFSTSDSCDKILICSLVLEGDTEHVINYSPQNTYMNNKWLPAVSQLVFIIAVGDGNMLLSTWVHFRSAFEARTVCSNFLSSAICFTVCAYPFCHFCLSLYTWSGADKTINTMVCGAWHAYRLNQK